MTTSHERAAKLDRRSLARLHAEIIDCADDPHKLSHHSMIEDLRQHGVEVSFKQVENALRALGYKWKEVFLPASNSDRGKKPRQLKVDELQPTQELTSAPDIQALLDRIEELEQTLTTSGLSHYSGLGSRIQSEAERFTERSVCIHTDVKRAVAKSRELHQQALEQAQLAKERAEAIQADMKKMMEWTQTLASVAGKVSKMENWLFSVFLHVVPQSNPSEKEAQQ